MARYEIHGGTPLRGSVTISGAKNAAVAILPAAILIEGKCRVENVPDISDVRVLLSILQDLGVVVEKLPGGTVTLDSTHIRSTKPNPELVKKMRASYYLMGALLSRFGQADVALPGGCNFANRPIDQHIKGFKALGARVEETDAYVQLSPGENGLAGNRVSLDVVSVGATMNIIMAATLLPGQTVIENAAKEPHIVDLANFLNTMGADISGAGTDTIKIRGVERLTGGTYAIIPDQIEAGTYLAAVAAVGGDVLVKNVIPKHLDCITAKLAEMGAEITEFDDALLVKRHGPLQKTNIKTLPYPGFPTDMQPQATVILSMASGMSLVTEGVWDSRYRYVEELRRMGAQIQVDGKTAIVEGVETLTGAPVKACDLRAGAALVIAGLAAKGTTEVENVIYIERGYERLVEKLTAIGARIKKVEMAEGTVIPKAQ